MSKSIINLVILIAVVLFSFHLSSCKQCGKNKDKYGHNPMHRTDTANSGSISAFDLGSGSVPDPVSGSVPDNALASTLTPDEQAAEFASPLLKAERAMNAAVMIAMKATIFGVHTDVASLADAATAINNVEKALEDVRQTKVKLEGEAKDRLVEVLVKLGKLEDEARCDVDSYPEVVRQYIIDYHLAAQISETPTDQAAKVIVYEMLKVHKEAVDVANDAGMVEDIISIFLEETRRAREMVENAAHNVVMGDGNLKAVQMARDRVENVARGVEGGVGKELLLVFLENKVLTPEDKANNHTGYAYAKIARIWLDIATNVVKDALAAKKEDSKQADAELDKVFAGAQSAEICSKGADVIYKRLMKVR
jgi:hypothetical protein